MEAFCDPVRVAQILRILLDNALTHTGEGVRVVVTAARRDGQVCGSRSATTARASHRTPPTGSSSRSTPPAAPAAPASGLAIASELAERMAGRLEVRSRPGETVFTLDLPG